MTTRYPTRSHLHREWASRHLGRISESPEDKTIVARANDMVRKESTATIDWPRHRHTALHSTAQCAQYIHAPRGRGNTGHRDPSPKGPPHRTDCACDASTTALLAYVKVRHRNAVVPNGTAERWPVPPTAKGKLISRFLLLGPTTEMQASSASDALLGRFPNASLDRRVGDGRFVFRHERVRVYGTHGRRFGCCLRLLSKRVRTYLQQQRKFLVTVSELPLRMQGRSQGCYLPHIIHLGLSRRSAGRTRARGPWPMFDGT
jgi:hypothetical protein